MTTQRSSADKYFAYFLPTVIFLSVFAGCIAMGPYLFNSDGDLGRHITLGRIILERGSIPTLDELSHTRLGDPFSPHEWIAEVIFALAYTWFGLSGVVLVTGAVLGLVFWLLTYRVLKISASTPITLILIVIGLAASRIHWLARPHIFTYIFLLLMVELVQSRMRFRWKLLCYAILQLLWVNTHGAFVSGLAVLGMILVGDAVDALRQKQNPLQAPPVRENLALFFLGLALSLINPDGIQIWATIYGFLSSRYLVSHTAEYQPPNLLQTGVLPFTIMLALGLVCAVIAFRRLALRKILLLIFFGIFGITSGRNIPLYILLALPILAEGFAPLLPRFRMQLDAQLGGVDQPAQSSPLNLAVFLSVLFVLSFGFGGLIYRLQPGLSSRNELSPQKFPVEAVTWLETHPQQGNVFNDFMWGGYLLFRSYPDIKVFIDGQTDFYGEALTRDYESIINAWDGWQTKLASYRVDWVLVRTDSPLWRAILADPLAWQPVYSDDTAGIARRID